MNKHGAVGLAILFAVVYFIAGLTLYQFVKPVIAEARIDNSCTNPGTWGDKLVCLLFDAIIPYLIIGILAASGAILTKEGLK